MIEFIYKGHFSHWSMFLVGGLCFLITGEINEVFTWDMPLSLQALIATAIITLIEFISGYILNIKLNLGVWDYSKLPCNILGQICLPFMAIWFVLSVIAIILDDYLRYWWFDEEKPHYKL